VAGRLWRTALPWALVAVLGVAAGWTNAGALADSAYSVSSEAALASAIQNVDEAATGAYTIALAQNITLASDLPWVHTAATLTIDGQGHTLEGDGTARGLFVDTGRVVIENLAFDGLTAQGGAGTGGGGGGAGLGGALFVGSGANVTLDGDVFENDTAIGGPGSTSVSHGQGGGGGMGGPGGPGGQANATAAGGGGGGLGGGASGGGPSGAGVAGIAYGAVGGGCGGNGGGAGGTSGGGGGGGASAGAGGGGGVGALSPTPVRAGSGGFGGGGGGAVQGSGGTGGFGGGGGAGDVGGAGGFGGGGGAGRTSPTPAPGGFGGGMGSSSTGLVGAGGGGLAAGGAIFVQQGGSLTMVGDLSEAGSRVAGGAGGVSQEVAAQGGYGFGSGLFLDGAGNLSISPGAGQTVSIGDSMADVSSASGGVDPGAWTVTKVGAGTLIVAGADPLATTVRAGTLILDGDQTAAVNVDGGGLLVDGVLAAAPSITGGTVGGVGSVPSLLLPKGATVQPGDPGLPGILRVVGNATLGVGSSFALAGGPSGFSELSAGGRVAIAGARLVAAVTGAPSIPQTYTLIQASGGVLGTFAGVPNGATVALGTSAMGAVHYTSDAVTMTVTARPSPAPTPVPEPAPLPTVLVSRRVGPAGGTVGARVGGLSISAIVPPGAFATEETVTLSTQSAGAFARTVGVPHGRRLLAAVGVSVTGSAPTKAVTLVVAGPGIARADAMEAFTGGKPTPLAARVASGEASVSLAAGAEVALLAPVPAASLRLTEPSMPPAVAGDSYAFALTAQGGRPPYRWTATGALPPGLRVHGAAGLIAGVPERAGTYTIHVAAVDSSVAAVTGQQTAVIVVQPASAVRVVWTGDGPVAAPDANGTFAFALRNVGGRTTRVRLEVTSMRRDGKDAPGAVSFDGFSMLLRPGQRAVALLDYVVSARAAPGTYNAQLVVTGAGSQAIRLPFTFTVP